MATYKVTSDREVAGKQTGETVTDDDLIGANVEALIEAGHIQKIKSTKLENQERE